MATSTYSIKDLEQITSIKAHTLRIWEKRYQIVSPQRTPTNIRYYTDDDLKRLLNISILNRNGHKISHLAKLSEEDLNEKILTLNSQNFDTDIHLENLVVAMIDLDETKFEKELSKLILNWGFEQSFNQVLIPLFDKIGLLWQIGTINPAHEHFMSNLIRQKLIVAIDGIIPDKVPKNIKSFILYLPEGELHEIGLLYYSYIIQKMGHKVIYLGQMVPFDNVLQIAEAHNPDGFITIMTSNFSMSDIDDHLQQLAKQFAGKQIMVSGFQFKTHQIKLPKGITLIKSPELLKQKIKSR